MLLMDVIMWEGREGRPRINISDCSGMLSIKPDALTMELACLRLDGGVPTED